MRGQDTFRHIVAEFCKELKEFNKQAGYKAYLWSLNSQLIKSDDKDALCAALKGSPSTSKVENLVFRADTIQE